MTTRERAAVAKLLELRYTFDGEAWNPPGKGRPRAEVNLELARSFIRQGLSIRVAAQRIGVSEFTLRYRLKNP